MSDQPLSVDAQSDSNASAINFRLNGSDLARFGAMVTKRGDRWLPNYLRGIIPYAAVLALFVVVLIVLLIIPATSVVKTNPFFYATLVLGSLVSLLFVERYKQSRIHRPSPNGAFLKPRAIELEDDGFLIVERGGQLACLWTSVMDVVEDDHLVALFVDSNMAHLIPKQAFATPGDAQRFAAYCRERVYLAKS